MTHLKKKAVFIFIVVILLSPSMIAINSIEPISEGSTQGDQVVETDITENVQVEDTHEDTTTRAKAYSLDGEPLENVPDFVRDDESDYSPIINSFTLSADDPTKPNITEFRYQNLTDDDGSDVTWMHPNEPVRIWFKVKGPLSAGGPEVRLNFDGIVDKSTDWKYNPLIDDDINDIVELTENESVWLSAQLTLPADTGSNYGWGNGLINAFAPSLYTPFIAFVQDFEELYLGLKEKSSYLHMFGEVKIKRTNWYNYTFDSADPEKIPCTVAERNWVVLPEYEFWVANAPVWDIGFKSYCYREIVFWPNENILTSADDMQSRMNPGAYRYRPTDGDSWVGWMLEEDWEYGTSIGQTSGIYLILHFYSGGIWEDIYDSRNEGEYLRLVEEIKEQEPQIEILNPLDSEVIEQSTTTLRAIISDPNSNQEISDIILYIDGVETSIFSLYNYLTGNIELEIDIPESSGQVNITIKAIDETGLVGSTTIFVISDSPADYFPASYSTTYSHILESLSSQVFAWEFPLGVYLGPDLNVSLTPTVEFGFDLSIAFDMYSSKPTQTYGGQNFTTYVSVTDPVISLDIWLTACVNYEIQIQSSVITGDVTIIDELWETSTKVPLGIQILDLRYDLPGISKYIKKYTNYEINFLDFFPLIGDFANLDLIIDIIPQLKISNVLSTVIAGTDCSPERDSISFVSDKMFAITATVDDSASGGTADILLNDITLESTTGLDLWVNLTLNGGVMGYTLASIDMNQWLQDNLGIVVPHLSFWNSKTSIPIVSQISIQTDVAEQQMDVEMRELFADEDTIDFTILVEDEQENGIASVTIDASIGTETCTVSETGSGLYTIEIQYRDSEFNLDVTVTKSGYLSDSETFTIYVDPITVDSTAPSISGLTVTPESPTSSDSVTVSVSLTDDLTSVVDPVLYYSIDNGASWSSIDMTHISGSNYEATIPAQSEDTKVLYYISVSDEAGNDISSDQSEYTVSDTSTTTTTTTSTGTTSTDTTTNTASTTTSSNTPNTPTPTDADMLGILTVSMGVVGAISVIGIIFLLRKKPS